MDIKLQFNWQLTDHDESLQIDPVLFALLESIQKEGSLKKATDKVGVSYRFAWGLVNKWEAFLKQPLVIMARGQGTKLAPAGEKLMHANRQLQANYGPELANFATELRADLISINEASLSEGLHIFASHGLAVSALRDVINQQTDFKLDLHFHGSLESLQAMRSRACHIAGFHIPVGKFGEQISKDYLNYLPPEQHQLIYIIKRNQGLMVARHNPKNINSLHSLLNSRISFINRESHSGTRLLFDQLINEANIRAEDINGYQHEEFTHMAVAAMVASGAADVGFGIQAIASKFNLDFIPMAWEHYCLAVPIELMKDPRIQEMLALLKSETFKSQLYSLNGYLADRAGEKVSFDEILGGHS